ncbi:MAG: crotonase/enoyl-CoA hydratase family protein [Pseudomonadales bacterium]|jgi:enoyl-CoA hydratase|nr:crotonase/enoyl-CoA hydratase family protein [Pseudomonadales bacterium]MDP7357414.1 crotonase/enoyl-CoA hydratase family protein [Pseudomonadales bacterium]MDP7595514.1 crotonase/enoyl-CoA hydratase family protein [Pseudomonadales bacterium]HJN52466.1 crotonase/enoyl-CoA hydratase family protein [Pseudomonadales bacterium]|tara:strand:+ start:25 stop:690 length:666 start_codon:yes stop_codon:yes gene_type:complete
MSIVNYEQQGDVAIVTMDDGKANAMNPDMAEAINSALDKAEASAKAVVITGRPGVFSGGFDLKIIRSGDPAAAQQMRLAGTRVLMRIYGFPKPIIMAALGHSLALGGFLLLTGDYRIGASGDFTIGLNEVAIGMTLPPFAMMLATARIDNRHLSNAAINANMYNPDQAIAAGFLDEVVAPDEVVARAVEKASAMAELDGAAFAQTKLDFRGADIDRILSAL